MKNLSFRPIWNYVAKNRISRKKSAYISSNIKNNIGTSTSLNQDWQNNYFWWAFTYESSHRERLKRWWLLLSGMMIVPELWITANDKVDLSGTDDWECVCVCVTHTLYSSDTETGRNINPGSVSLRQWHTSAAWHHRYCLVKYPQPTNINAVVIWM